MSRSNPSSVLLLTPKMNGRDGISLVSRTALAAFKQFRHFDRIAVWTLADQSFTPEQSGPGLCCATAGGSKLELTKWGWGAALRTNGRYDLLLVLHLHLLPVALPMAMRGVRLGIFLHGIEAWKPLTRLQDAGFRRASFVLANSHYTAERFKQINPQHAQLEISICHLGIPTVPEASGDSLLSEGPYALIVSRMSRESRYKGHDSLIDLWPEVLRHAPGFRLFVVGDGDERPRLEQAVKTAGLAEHVKLLGLVDDQKLQRLYEGCSFYMMPSSGEGFGLVFLEAMRASKACIAGAGAAAEVVQDGVTGLVVDPSSPYELLGAILQLIQHPDRAQRMGVAGYQRFLEHFTQESFGLRLHRALGLESLGVSGCAG